MVPQGSSSVLGAASPPGPSVFTVTRPPTCFSLRNGQEIKKVGEQNIKDETQVEDPNLRKPFGRLPRQPHFRSLTPSRFQRFRRCLLLCRLFLVDMIDSLQCSSCERTIPQGFVDICLFSALLEQRQVPLPTLLCG